METTVVMFAIQAGIKLGRKLNDVLIDKTRERPLILPLGNLYGNVLENDALDYFRDHPELTASGCPYSGLNHEEKIKAYRTILALEEKLGDSGGMAGDAREIVINMQKFKQFKDGYGAKPALQRILGEVVEIAIDYFAARPELLAGDTNSGKILAAFITNLDDVEFAEATPRAIVNDILIASLKVLDANTVLVDDDLRLQALIGGITKSLIEDYDSIASLGDASLGDQIRRKNLIKRVASSIIRGGATAFSQNIDLFLRKDSSTKKLVESTLSQVITGITGKEDLFTNESVELLFKSALQAAADHAEVFSKQKVFQEFIGKTLGDLTNVYGSKVFSGDMVSVVLQNALETVSLHVDTLIKTDTPQKQLLADTVRVLSVTLIADIGSGKKVKDLFSRKQLITLTRIIFEEVAKHPEQLLGGDITDDRCTALSQTIGSVVQALAEMPEHLLFGEGLIRIIKTAIQVVAQNASKLLDINSTDVRQNILYQAINQVVEPILANSDNRRLITGEVFQEIVSRILPLVSANIEALLPGDSRPIAGIQAIAGIMEKVLVLAGGVLENRINCSNLSALTEQLLTLVFWDELDPEDNAAIENASSLILRNLTYQESHIRNLI